MRTAKSSSDMKIMVVLATGILWGCNPQDPAENSVDAPTAETVIAPDSITQNQSFTATSTALEQHGIMNRISTALMSTQKRWLPTGLQVKSGMPLTIFGSGALVLDSTRFEPRNIGWFRIGEDGDAIKLASNQDTFYADRSGELYLTVPPPGLYWENRTGDYPDDMSGWPEYPMNMEFIAVQWSGEPETMLQQLVQGENDPFELALQRLNNPKLLPDGFSYLWYLGQSEVFDRFDDGERSGIHGYADHDYGIVKKEVDLPLTEDAQIRFDWLYSMLPAEGPETDAQFHDYLSIAVEFDNGQDITWMWSRNLDVEHGFRCPLFWWDERETHIVLQSGTDGLGNWYSHRRDIASDYIAHVEGEAPARIVGVWFIATSLSATPGDAKFANVTLTVGGQNINIF